MKKIAIILIFLATGILLLFWRYYPQHNVSVPMAALNSLPVINASAPKEPINVYFVGDVMLDRGVEALMLKNGFDYPYRNIMGIFPANSLVIGNLEGPIVKNPPFLGARGMSFAFDPRNLSELKNIGFTHFSLANNHVFNMGNSGFSQTKKYLADSEIVSIGSERECSARYVTTSEEFVFVAFSQVFTDCSDSQISSTIKQLKTDFPEKFLIVLIHWGEEYKTTSNLIQQNTAHLMIDNGADLIIGGHPHVVEESEIYKEKLIVYSLGNFVFDQYFSKETQEGLIVKMIFQKDKQEFEFLPFFSKKSQIFLFQGEDKSKYLQEYFAKCKNLLPQDLESGIIKTIK